MAYIIFVNDDNTLYGSCKSRIMQRSKCVDTLTFVVNRIYKGIDMADTTVMLEYLLPVSKTYKTEYLKLSEERYKEEKYKDCFLQYKLPFDTNITSEAGAVELQLTFVSTGLDAKGNGTQRVRKTSTTTIDIIPISAWSDIIPDESLLALDQRILAQDAQIRALADLANVLDGAQVDNLVYNPAEDTLQLSAKGVKIGNKVSVKEMLDDGIPVVDLDNRDTDADSNPNGGGSCNCNCNCDCEDNVVEFDDVTSNDTSINPIDDNVVEF